MCGRCPSRTGLGPGVVPGDAACRSRGLVRPQKLGDHPEGIRRADRGRRLPARALQSGKGVARARWFADYVPLVIERDMLEPSRIRQRVMLPRLLRQLAGQTAGY